MVFYFSFQGNTRDVVAIKCIEKQSLSKRATENLLTEIELLKKLDHEHIVKLKDFEVLKYNDCYRKSSIKPPRGLIYFKYT